MHDDLEQLVAFLNTVDVEAGTDTLDDAVAATRWAAEHGLLPGSTTLSSRDLRRARALRDVLRRLARAHHEGTVDPGATAEFDALARSLPLQATVDHDGFVGLGPHAADGTAVLARLIAAVVLAALTDGWPRIKVCPADDCQLAFVDHSRNRSRRWCAMGECGNRQKVRSYRERQRDRRGSPGDGE